MARVLIVTQGALAEVLADAARTIAGSDCDVRALALGWDDGIDEAELKLTAAFADLGPPEDGILVLTDVPGGTPFNVAARFAEPGRIAVVTGVNLPMVVRVCCPGCGDLGVDGLAAWLVEKGRKSICLAEGSDPKRSGHAEPSGPAELSDD